MKRTDLLSKLKEMSLPELNKELALVMVKKEQIRLNNKVGKSKNSSELRVLSDQIAKLRTLITEQTLAAEVQAAVSPQRKAKKA